MRVFIINIVVKITPASSLVLRNSSIRHCQCCHWWSTMIMPSNGNIFHVTGPLCGEFPSQRPTTWSFDDFFNLHLNEWLSKQSWRRWFETSSCSLWCHYNIYIVITCLNLHEILIWNSLPWWVSFHPWTSILDHSVVSFVLFCFWGTYWQELKFVLPVTGEGEVHTSVNLIDNDQGTLITASGNGLIKPMISVNKK